MQKHVPPLTDRHFAVTRRNPSRLRIKLRRGRRLSHGMTGAIERKSTIRYLQVQHSIIKSPAEYRFSIKLSCRQVLAPGSLDFALGMTELMDRAILRRDGRGSAQTATNRLRRARGSLDPHSIRDRRVHLSD